MTHRPSGDADPILDSLPTAHAVLLRLRWAGAGDDQIALALGVPESSVPTLLQVALSKLDESRKDPT